MQTFNDKVAMYRSGIRDGRYLAILLAQDGAMSAPDVNEETLNETVRKC